MREELELKLQEEFEFMWQNNVDEEEVPYRGWGCECSAGWYDIIRAFQSRLVLAQKNLGLGYLLLPIT